MHYVPESATEFLPDDRFGDDDETSFHYQSAPVYLLTLVVGLLLMADTLLALDWLSAYRGWQTAFGFRLALIAAVLGGSRILYQTLDGLFDGVIGADLALSIAAIAAVLLGEPHTAALVVLIALIGESIEGYTIDRARRAIRSVFQLWPAVAHRLLDDDSEDDVLVEALVAGDRVVVRPGERLPVDGIVEAGNSMVDQSFADGRKPSR